ncbi:MAG: M48 family metallopeptidase [Bacteroidetes bacterium]|nr:M48 family metallopeptidase [Bacteroidota bacterium]
MKKIILQFLTILILFYACWFALYQVDWMKFFKIEQITKKTEEKLGDLYWDIIQKTENENNSDSIVYKVDIVLNHICQANNIDRKKIKLHILKKDDINAFALPNNHLIIYSGLIEECENEAEMSGVLCHEIAHMEKQHVMKKLGKEVGLAVLVSMTTGSGNGEVAKRTLKLLSSNAYDRNLESEADLTAADYLIKANIDPEPFANFLFRLAKNEKNLPKQVFWISTHPDSEERSLKIIEYIKNKEILKDSLLSGKQWNSLKEQIKQTE